MKKEKKGTINCIAMKINYFLHLQIDRADTYFD
jgi:hypothetical protein